MLSGSLAYSDPSGDESPWAARIWGLQGAEIAVRFLVAQQYGWNMTKAELWPARSETLDLGAAGTLLESSLRP